MESLVTTEWRWFRASSSSIRIRSHVCIYTLLLYVHGILACAYCTLHTIYSHYIYRYIVDLSLLTLMFCFINAKIPWQIIQKDLVTINKLIHINRSTAMHAGSHEWMNVDTQHAFQHNIIFSWYTLTYNWFSNLMSFLIHMTAVISHLTMDLSSSLQQMYLSTLWPPHIKSESRAQLKQTLITIMCFAEISTLIACAKVINSMPLTVTNQLFFLTSIAIRVFIYVFCLDCSNEL